VYIKPDIRNVKVLEFYKAREVFEQARPAQRQLEKGLKRAIRRHDGWSGCTAA
jgi:predicted acylesterase/phospholipase RssA